MLKKIFSCAAFVCSFCACSGIPTEREVTVSDVDITGFIKSYVKVVDSTYKFTTDGDKASISVKLELTDKPDVEFHKDGWDIRLNAIDETGSVFDTGTYGFSCKEFSKISELLKGNVGEMGYDDVKVGDTVTLDYRAGMQSEYKPEEFVVSGILYDRDEYTIEASYVAFGSQEFYDEHVAENDRQYNIYFTLNDSANVSMNNIDSVIKQIAAACGIEEKNVIVNDLYLQWVLQPSYETIAVCGVLILAIVLFSVVVIYNIFQVGIVNKIQEYGKIKALGATKKQMKQLIFREGIFLTFFSISVGLLLGFLIAKYYK